MRVRGIIDQVIDQAGGFTNETSRPEGPAKYGISQSRLSFWRGYPVNVADVQQLSKDEASEIYEHDCFLRPRFDWLPEAVHAAAVEVSLMIGPVRTASVIRRVVSKMGRPIPENGPIDRAAVDAAVLAVRTYHDEVERQIILAGQAEKGNQK